MTLEQNPNNKPSLREQTPPQIKREVGYEEALEGWSYQHRFQNPETYEGEGLHRVNREATSFAALPQTMFDLVAEVNDSLIPEENKTIAENVIAWAKTLDDRIALP